MILSDKPVAGANIIEIQPCTEEGLVTMEAKLAGRSGSADYFDPALLCRYIMASPAFTKQRCSVEMGYGVAERKGRNVHAFKAGTVIVRRAEGKEMALEHLHLISRSLWPAMNVCGLAALVDCLVSGGECPKFPAPPADGGELEMTRTFAEALGDARTQPRWSLIEEGLGQLRAVAAAYPQSGATKATKEQFRKVEGSILGYIVETEDVKKAALGIPFLGASLLLDRAMQECERLDADKRAAFWESAVRAFDATVNGSGAAADSGPHPAFARLSAARIP
jgi:hypothetical protein